jgi:hypothetical protein
MAQEAPNLITRETPYYIFIFPGYRPSMINQKPSVDMA